MRLVIEIPEDLKYAFEHETDWTHEEECVRVLCARMRNVLENGTLLPKGCGDLVDRDAIWHEYDYSDMGYTMIDALNDAPTIVEADKEIKE